MYGETPLYQNATTATAVTEYSAAHSDALPEHINAQRAWGIATLTPGRADMMISPLQAQLQIWLARAVGAKRILEIGAFIGYSGLGWAHAVRDQADAKIVTLEFDPEAAQISRNVFAKADLGDLVEVIEGDANKTLQDLAASDKFGAFDLVFIDADKVSYPKYLALLLAHSQPGATKRLLRPGAIILADNTFKHGLVADDSQQNPYADDAQRNNPVDKVALRQYNDDVLASGRLEKFLLPLFDGINMARLVD